MRARAAARLEVGDRGRRARPRARGRSDSRSSRRSIAVERGPRASVASAAPRLSRARCVASRRGASEAGGDRVGDPISRLRADRAARRSPSEATGVAAVVARMLQEARAAAASPRAAASMSSIPASVHHDQAWRPSRCSRSSTGSIASTASEESLGGRTAVRHRAGCREVEPRLALGVADAARASRELRFELVARGAGCARDEQCERARTTFRREVSIDRLSDKHRTHHTYIGHSGRPSFEGLRVPLPAVASGVDGNDRRSPWGGGPT